MLYPQFFKKISLFIQKSKYAIIALACFLFIEKVGAAVNITVDNPLAPTDSIEGLLQQVLNYFLTFLAAPLMIIVLIIAGIRYLTAGANQTRAQSAKNMMKWALIGIVLIVGALAIVNTVVSLITGAQ